MRAWPGSAYPLGATWDGPGTNFAIFSEVADQVELCLFDAAGAETRVALTETDGHAWHGYLPDVGPGQRYGYRVHGPWDPAGGHLCNPAKLLLDPYGKAVDGAVTSHPTLYSYARQGGELVRDLADSGPFMAKNLVIDQRFDWAGDVQLRTPPQDSVIYEAHVRGLTKLHPGVPASLRGSYAGLAAPAVTRHLQRIGVTAVELLPVHQFASEPALADRGLANYWGYNSIGFFAPHLAYAADQANPVAEFKSMVMTLHQAGIEVFLDVVYNHTSEGGPFGPTMCFRGIDNAAYYRLADGDPATYVDYTACGNTVNVTHPRALAMIMDSLRYWVSEMHVDGFRFDLAPALARQYRDFDPRAPFLAAAAQDPVLAQVKFIAEPWDVGSGGYQLGAFPPPWAEWNGKYRDTARDFWRGVPGQLPELATRLAGSSDLFHASGRRPAASVNFVTCHDGFTLADLVGYDRKHNEANGPGQDGTDDNRSWNCGAEGPTDDPQVSALRARQVRNFLVTLLLSQGTPMLLAGDEFGNSQRGNNNAFCQDNEISWLDWTGADQDLTGFVATLTALRRAHPVLRRQRFLTGRAGDSPAGRPDVRWLSPAGAELTGADWTQPGANCLGVILSGAAITEPSPRGEQVTDADFALLFNGSAEQVTFRLPAALTRPGTGWSLWQVVIGTGTFAAPSADAAGNLAMPVTGRSVTVLRAPR